MVELSFPSIAPQTFLGIDVVMKGATPGDVVHLTEPFQKPAGISFFCYVRDDDTVRICAKNNTGDVTISVPPASFGLIIDCPQPS